MKKVISALLLTFIVTISATSCTDENVKPQDGGDNPGECAQGWCK